MCAAIYCRSSGFDAGHTREDAIGKYGYPPMKIGRGFQDYRLPLFAVGPSFERFKRSYYMETKFKS